MNEYVYVEILIDNNCILKDCLGYLFDDFTFLHQNLNTHSGSTIYCGKMTSAGLTALKLRNPDLAIHVSYIDNNLKDRYRK